VPAEPEHGATVQIEALERSAENEQGGYLWRGELRYATLARDQEQAKAVMTRLLDEAEAPA
jgi:hypothetical protein